MEITPNIQRLDPGYVPGPRESTNVEDRRPKTLSEHLGNLHWGLGQQDVQGISRQLMLEEYLRAWASGNLNQNVFPAGGSGRRLTFEELRQMYLDAQGKR